MQVSAQICGAITATEGELPSPDINISWFLGLAAGFLWEASSGSQTPKTA